MHTRQFFLKYIKIQQRASSVIFRNILSAVTLCRDSHSDLQADTVLSELAVNIFFQR